MDGEAADLRRSRRSGTLSRHRDYARRSGDWTAERRLRRSRLNHLSHLISMYLLRICLRQCDESATLIGGPLMT